MADPFDVSMGLLQGLNRGIGAFAEARDRRDARELDMASKGLIMGPDGKIIRDPAELARERRKNKLDTQLKLAEMGRLAGDDQFDEDSQLKAVPDYDPKYLAMKIKERLSMTPEKTKWDAIPKDQQIKIEGLTREVTSREAIVNDISAGLEQLKDPKISEDEKVILGREMLKTLNSAQGKDAIGAEEAKRLGGLLESQVRLFSPGKLFGRDLPLFTSQVENNLSRLKKSTTTGQSQIDQLMGRGGGLLNSAGGLVQPGAGAAQPQIDPKIEQWAKENGLDYKAAEKILRARGYGG